MKKVFSALVLISLLVVPAVSLANGCTSLDNVSCKNAQKNGCIWNPNEKVCTGVYIGGAADFITLINNVGNWIFVTLLAIAGIMLIIAGFFWIAAGGNPENVKTASGMLRNALIGVAIALGARGMIVIITNILGG